MPIPPNVDPWLPPGTDPVPLVGVGVYVQVFRRSMSSDGLTEDQLLDNVECVGGQQRQGTDPGSASFRYVFMDNGDPTAPQSFEAALDADTVYPKSVLSGDRLLVGATRPDGAFIYLFAGDVLGFEVILDGDTEVVTFTAQGVARSLWDQVIGGAYTRYANQPTVKTANQQTDLVAQFNARVAGKTARNATYAGGDVEVGSFRYPVFIDPLIVGRDPPHENRYWTLAMAARYLIYHHNADELTVTNPLPDDVDALLVAREPIDGVPFDPSDATTYTTRDIACPNTPITGRDWPTVLHQLVRNAGFGMSFRLDTVGGDAQCRLDLFVLQGGPVKDLWLQPAGSNLDPRYCNLGGASIGRDLKQVINEWRVDGALVKYQGDFILSPMFPMATADGASSAALRAYDRSNPLFLAGNRDAYRLYGFDETGDGHYAVGTSTKLVTPPDFTTLFNTGPFSYTVRRRPGLGDLISVDSKGVAYRAQLEYSTNYAGVKPGLWNGTGTWQPITRGWQIRHDRLAIWISIDDPNHWNIGEDATTGAPLFLKGVEDQCSVQAGKNFTLRLTCVVEGDTCCTATAGRTINSPLGETITRRIDARDRYFKEVISGTSLFTSGTDPVVARDDSDLAMAEAVQNRTATEAGILDGQIEIPYVTDYYQIGDRIRQINGRGLGFRTDGGGLDSTPVYPVVIGRAWTFGEHQSTTLFLSDEATERHTIERKIRR